MTLEDAKPDVTADLSGKTCPYTVMGARDALKPLRKGQFLEVIVDYQPAAEESIPNFLRKKKYPYHVSEVVAGKWRFIIEKSD